MIYRCRVLDGTGTAKKHFGELLNRWADVAGYRKLYPGSLNLGSDRPITLPAEYVTLEPWAHLCCRQGERWLSPRLYECRLNGTMPAWVFRWCAPKHNAEFVGHQNGCPPERRMEVVAGVRLKKALRLKIGSAVDLEFLR